MVQALARASVRLCTLLPSLALVLGAAGYVVRYHAIQEMHAEQAESKQASPELLQIDALLSTRLPGLGLSLRRRVAQAILEESRNARFDPMFVLGLIEVESSFCGEAVSYAGARGLMQLTPATMEYLAGQEGLRLTSKEIWRDPSLQIRLGVRYLSRLEKRFRSLDLALMAYNAGPENVKAALEDNDPNRFGGYVRAVRLNHARFRKRLAASTVARADRPGPKLVDGADVMVLPR